VATAQCSLSPIRKGGAFVRPESDLAPALFEAVASTQGQGERYFRKDLTARSDYAKRIDPVPGT